MTTSLWPPDPTLPPALPPPTLQSPHQSSDDEASFLRVIDDQSFDIVASYPLLPQEVCGGGGGVRESVGWVESGNSLMKESSLPCLLS